MSYLLKIILVISFACMFGFGALVVSEQHYHGYAQGCPISSIEALPCPRENLFAFALLVFSFVTLPFSQLFFANIHRGAIAEPTAAQEVIPNHFIRWLSLLQKRDPVN